MSKKKVKIIGENENCCCNLDAVVTLDPKGQIVLPKEIREKNKLKSGDKLAVISPGDGNDTCCIILLKAEDCAKQIKIQLKI